MGIAVWILAGIVSFVVGRVIPLRRHGWPAELIIAGAAAAIAGLAATAMDFGGWREADWRAGTFALFAALAAIGLARLWPLRSPT